MTDSDESLSDDSILQAAASEDSDSGSELEVKFKSKVKPSIEQLQTMYPVLLRTPTSTGK